MARPTNWRLRYVADYRANVWRRKGRHAWSLLFSLAAARDIPLSSSLSTSFGFTFFFSFFFFSLTASQRLPAWAVNSSFFSFAAYTRPLPQRRVQEGLVLFWKIRSLPARGWTAGECLIDFCIICDEGFTCFWLPGLVFLALVSIRLNTFWFDLFPLSSHFISGKFSVYRGFVNNRGV